MKILYITWKGIFKMQTFFNGKGSKIIRGLVKWLNNLQTTLILNISLLICCNKSVSYTHLDVYKRQICGSYRSSQKTLPLLKHKTLPVNYPFPLTDLHQKQQVLSTLQYRGVCLSLIHIQMCIRDSYQVHSQYSVCPLKSTSCHMAEKNIISVA